MNQSVPVAVQEQCDSLHERAQRLLTRTGERVDAVAAHLDAWAATRERWDLLRNASTSTFGALVDDADEVRARLVAAHAARCVTAHRVSRPLVAAVAVDAWSECVRLQSELLDVTRRHLGSPALTAALCDAADGRAERLVQVERCLADVRRMCCGVHDLRLGDELLADASFLALSQACASVDALRQR